MGRSRRVLSDDALEVAGDEAFALPASSKSSTTLIVAIGSRRRRRLRAALVGPLLLGGAHDGIRDHYQRPDGWHRISCHDPVVRFHAHRVRGLPDRARDPSGGDLCGNYRGRWYRRRTPTAEGPEA